MNKEKIEAYITILVNEQRKFETTEDAVKKNNAQGLLEGYLGTDIPEEGDDLDILMKIHENLTKVQVNWGHSNFLAFFPSRMSDLSKSADFLSNLHPAYTSPAESHGEADRLERGLTEELRVLFGLSDEFSWKQVCRLLS